MPNALELLRADRRLLQTMLTRLHLTHGGRWIVFQDGQVISDHATGDQASRAAIAAFGPGGRYLITQVPQEPSEGSDRAAS